MFFNDTIAAISTPLGEGGIGIVRLSGNKAFALVDKIFYCSHKGNPSYPRPRYLYYGTIKDGKGNIIDEVLVSHMPAPHTYTREDIVEINCHSGIFALRSILKLLLESGARLAEPGEFTRRAFINGRIDLSQAEAVLAMVRARSEEAVKAAARALQGELLHAITRIRENIIKIRAPLEAAFDYPEEFLNEDYSCEDLGGEILYLEAELSALLENVEKNRAYQEGASVAIIGRPNVGKSSLLNVLLKQQKAIVHETPGTTRDLLEGYMTLGGYPIRLIDTAGIQGSADPVELEGIERSRRAAEQAKIVIFVFDGSTAWSGGDRDIARLQQQGQGEVAVINKSDLCQELSPETVAEHLPQAEVVRTSAIKEEGIKRLEEAVTRQLDRVFSSSVGDSTIYSLRHEEVLSRARESLKNAFKILGKEPIELVSTELQSAWLKLGEITGDTLTEALLDKIFSEFCLGK